MILLTSNSPAHTLRVVTDAAVTVDVLAAYVDNNAGTVTPGSQATAISTASTTPVVSAPGASTQRAVQHLCITNRSASTSVNVIVEWFDATTAFRLIDASLGAGENLVYEDSSGWAIHASDGSIKQTTAGPGQLLRRTVYTTGSSATHTFLSGCKMVWVRGVAAGGGGGGTSSSASNCAVGGGGAAGGYMDFLLQGTFTTATYTVPSTGGTAGANTGGTGGTGSDTIVIINGTTYTAKGGLGGVGQTFGTGVATVLGGAGVVGTNGTINVGGAPGANGIRLSGTVGCSGAGGSSQFGNGGAARNANNAGIAGTGYGSGGGGSCSLSSAQTGGAGAPGLLIIEEYT